MRVYELARDIGQESKDVLARAQELGIAVKTASSGLDEDGAALIRLSYAEEMSDTADAAPEAVAAAPAPEPAAEPAAPSEVADAVDGEKPADENDAGPPDAGDDRIIEVAEGVTVQEFAQLIEERVGDVTRKLMALGEMVPGGGVIPRQLIERLGNEFGYEVLVEDAPEVEEEEKVARRKVIEFEDDPASLEPRPAVVTVMGHVDHGKTQLLDTIRKADVVAGEAGGITQHIGAYQIEQKGQRITFIDTPGHEAFTALRARGADVTDIVILVVAADDGVMPQTVEAINHAKAAEVPMIVAINKMDLPAANPTAVRAALTQHDVLVEELGGEVISAEVSALSGDGIDNLLELVALVAEVEDLKANSKAPGIGTVIEAQLDVGRGPVATVIVQRGNLAKGDAIVAGTASGRVRALHDERGDQMKDAGPSTPVLVTGWDAVPTAGDMFEVLPNERKARQAAERYADKIRAEDLVVPTATERLGQLLETLRTADHAELRVIVKADAHGSLEAIRDAIGKIMRDDGKIMMIHGGVGGITANDIMLADASEGIIYGFNVRPDTGARKAAKEHAIDIRTFSIIYELLEDIEQLLVGELTPEEVESFLGVAEVRATFRAPRYGMVAGCHVTEGEISRNAKVRLVRDSVVVYEGRITSLRRFKDDVASVAAGFECGIGLENFRDIKEGDTIESFVVREVART